MRDDRKKAHKDVEEAKDKIAAPKPKLPKFQQPVQPPTDEEKAEQLVQQAQALPELKAVKLPPKIQPQLTEKITTKEVTEEILELSEEERREFVYIFREKHDLLLKDIQSLRLKLDDFKLKEKQELDDDYRKKSKIIENKYEKQKSLIEQKYADKLERYKNLMDKFKQDGGETEHGEDKVKEFTAGKLFTTPTPPGPKIDKVSVKEEGDYHPEISSILKEIDEKHA